MDYAPVEIVLLEQSHPHFADGRVDAHCVAWTHSLAVLTELETASADCERVHYKLESGESGLFFGDADLWPYFRHCI